MKKNKRSNPDLHSLTSFLKKASKTYNVKIWRKIAEKLSTSKKRRTQVNLSRINRHTEKGEVVAVPGKVLGTGLLNHQVTIAAFQFSEIAKKKINEAKGKHLTLPELVKRHPKGSNIKIVV